MAASNTPGEWVQNSLDAHHRRMARRKRNPVTSPAPTLSAFHHRVMRMLARGLRCGIYDVNCAWERQDWRDPESVRLVVYAGNGLATFDFDSLTRFVIMAHDECIRFGVEPVSFRYFRLTFFNRGGREGPMYSRHPTLEQAIEDFRK